MKTKSFENRVGPLPYITEYEARLDMVDEVNNWVAQNNANPRDFQLTSYISLAETRMENNVQIHYHIVDVIGILVYEDKEDTKPVTETKLAKAA